MGSPELGDFQTEYNLFVATSIIFIIIKIFMKTYEVICITGNSIN